MRQFFPFADIEKIPADSPDRDMMPNGTRQERQLFRECSAEERNQASSNKQNSGDFQERSLFYPNALSPTARSHKTRPTADEYCD